MSARGAALSLVAAAALASCGGGAETTSVVVVLRTDMAAPTQFDALTVRVSDGSGVVVREQPLLDPMGAGDGTFHEVARFALRPRNGDATRRFEVLVSASLAGAVLYEARARSGFAAGEALRLVIDLPAACVAASCAADETCLVGGCGPPDLERAPSELPPAGAPGATLFTQEV